MQTNSKERKVHYSNNNNNSVMMDSHTFDREALNVALKSSSLLLWIPYTLAALYVTSCASFVILPTEFFTPYAHLFHDDLSVYNDSYSHYTLHETNNSNNLTNILDYAATTPSILSSSFSPSLPFSSSLSSLLLLLRRQHPPKELLQLYNSLLIPLLTSPSTESIRKLYALAHNTLREPNTFPFTAGNDELAQWCTFDWVFWFTSCLSVIIFSLIAVGSTYWCAVKLSNKGGEFLMVIAWVLGVVSEQWWLTSTQHHRYYNNHIHFHSNHSNHNNNIAIYTHSSHQNNNSIYNYIANSSYSNNNDLFQPTCSTSPHSFSLFNPPDQLTSSLPQFVNYDHYNEYPLSQFSFRTVPTPPSWLWLVVSMCTGLFSGILCKVKDIVDGKQDRNSRLSRWIHRRHAKRRFHSHLHSNSSHSIHHHTHQSYSDNVKGEGNSRSLQLPYNSNTSSTTTTGHSNNLESANELSEHSQPSQSNKESLSAPSTVPSSLSSPSSPQHHHNTFTVTNTINSALRERKNSQQQQHNNNYKEEGANQEKHTVAQAFAPGESFSFTPNSNNTKIDAIHNNNVNKEVNEQLSEEPLSPFLPIRRVRLHRSTGLGERLYMVVPFCTGQWFYFITHHGWRGVIVQNGIIVLSLAMVGYTMLSFKLLKKQVLKALLRPTVTAAPEANEIANTAEFYNYNEHGTATNVNNKNNVYRRPMIRSRSSSTVNITPDNTNTNNKGNEINDDNIANHIDEINTNNKKDEEEDVHKDNRENEIKEKDISEKEVENSTNIDNNSNNITPKENLSSSQPVIISASEANRMTQHHRRHRSSRKNNNSNKEAISENNSKLFTTGAKRSSAINDEVFEDSSESNDDDDASEDERNYDDEDEDESEDNAELANVEEKLVFDIIEIIFKLFTTSFGVVVLSVIAANIFLTTLAIPFIKALFSLNALVSSVGIIVELIIYDAV